LASHAGKNYRYKAKQLSVVLTTALVVSLSMQAQGSSSFSVGSSTLDFDKTSTEEQLDGQSGQPDFGEGISVSQYVDFLNVANLSGQQIDARVTFVSQYGVRSSDADGRLDKLDDATSTAGRNRWINTDIGWDINAQAEDRYAEFKIEFFKNLSSTPESVTLTNLKLSIYDIDKLQYVSISNFDRYYLASSGSILTVTQEGSLLRATSDATSTSTADPEGRLTVDFDSVSSFTYRLGVKKEQTDTSDSFSLDFGPGLSWAGLQGAAVDNPVTNPPQSQQTAPPSIGSYRGPVPISLSITCVPELKASTVSLMGDRLHTITSAQVEGLPIGLSDISRESLTMELPALSAGVYSVHFESSEGKVTHGNLLRVCAAQPAQSDSPAASPTKQVPFSVTKRFTNYQGDRGPLVPQDKIAIEKFIRANPGLKSVTCIGSTSGVPAISTDTALARNRAQNACRIVTSLVPGVRISIATSTGVGIGQFFRAVTITGQGAR